MAWVNPLTGLVRRLGRHPWLLRAAPVIIPLDRALHAVSGNRLSLVGLAGLPSLRLVTTGRRTGLPRTHDLLYTPYGDDYALVGSNWGRQAHPAWTVNLMANPNATVIVRGRAIPVVARQVVGAEAEDVWALAVRNWPAYVVERRLACREFRVFVLTAA